jgi:hypothetical protein
MDQDIRLLGERNWMNLALNMEEAFEEGQGPHSAVEPVIMMMKYIQVAF